MKIKKNNIDIKSFDISRINITLNIKYLFFSFLVLGLNACTDFIEVDPPKNTLITQTVFEDVKTAESALANIYVKMRDEGLLSGNAGMSVLIGAYADELDYFGFNTNEANLYNHNVTASDDTIFAWWSHAYNIIYAANDIISGVENSTTINSEDKEQLQGQALFIRAYLHSILVGLYGDIPYVETTSYVDNTVVVRMPVNEVYGKVIADLILAVSLLNDIDTSGERVLPNKAVANALLSRMYLYTENWALAETTATDLIDAYSLESDVNSVFLKNSVETLWQFKPDIFPINTREGDKLIITFIPTQGYALTSDLMNAFEPGDLRQIAWTESITSTDGLTTLNYAHKYKETVSSTELSLEYSIVFRLAEQYLIRSEARTKLDNIVGAQQDLNIIRNRAGLPNTLASNENDLLDAILQERHVELFTEHGNRWFDLKRTGNAPELLAPIKANWQNTNVLLPIPDTELLVNPNLKPQNLGY